MHATSSRTPEGSLVAQVLELPNLSIDELESLWLSLFHEKAPTKGRVFLQKRIAYKIQENALGSSEREQVDSNQRRIEALLVEDQQSQANTESEMPVGAVLSRLYQGKEYRVTVLPNRQFQCDGKIYGSLSETARAITGTRWSGPLFFGLRKRGPNHSTRRRRW